MRERWHRFSRPRRVTDERGVEGERPLEGGERAGRREAERGDGRCALWKDNVQDDGENERQAAVLAGKKKGKKGVERGIKNVRGIVHGCTVRLLAHAHAHGHGHARKGRDRRRWPGERRWFRAFGAAAWAWLGWVGQGVRSGKKKEGEKKKKRFKKPVAHLAWCFLYFASTTLTCT